MSEEKKKKEIKKACNAVFFMIPTGYETGVSKGDVSIFSSVFSFFSVD
jgi:hypothetical protein